MISDEQGVILESFHLLGFGDPLVPIRSLVDIHTEAKWMVSHGKPPRAARRSDVRLLRYGAAGRYFYSSELLGFPRKYLRVANLVRDSALFVRPFSVAASSLP